MSFEAASLEPDCGKPDFHDVLKTNPAVASLIMLLAQ